MKMKKPCEKAVRTTISMPPELWKLASGNQQAHSFPTFSDYIQHLIRAASPAHGR